MFGRKKKEKAKEPQVQDITRAYSVSDSLERFINALVELNSRLKKVDDFEKQLADLRMLVVNNTEFINGLRVEFEKKKSGR